MCLNGRAAFEHHNILVDHELLERVQIRWYQRADGLVVIIEDLLPLAL